MSQRLARKIYGLAVPPESVFRHAPKCWAAQRFFSKNLCRRRCTTGWIFSARFERFGFSRKTCFWNARCGLGGEATARGVRYRRALMILRWIQSRRTLRSQIDPKLLEMLHKNIVLFGLCPDHLLVQGGLQFE